ncbi:MAG: FMN-binding protein [Chloroflexota bacterium]
MAKRMTRGLVALSSAAILSIYGAGYVLTAPAAASMAAGTVIPAGSSPARATSAAGSGSPAIGRAPNQPTAAPTQRASGLKDGTYRGAGWSPRGSVNVAVTVAGGRIASAAITSVTTHYSQSAIAGLPSEVVSRQSGQVDLISGATDSSMAYRQAVTQALSQAGATAGLPGTTVPNGAGAGASGSSSAVPGTPGTSGGSVQVRTPAGIIYRSGEHDVGDDGHPFGRRERDFENHG